jgi:hypothetical protein
MSRLTDREPSSVTMGTQPVNAGVADAGPPATTSRPIRRSSDPQHEPEPAREISTMTYDDRERDTVVVDDRRGSGMGAVLGIIAIVVLLLAVWYFALGPGGSSSGTTNNNTTNNNGGPAATEQAPAATQQAPASLEAPVSS